ncbi:MAG TPA: DJ-1/PfpI family protein [Egibacteraceae bacterium]|nr:DJ-1/PfpI family protein [Egibacteraceae bacterium]
MTTVAILLFDDVDLMDVAGPYEVLLTASRLLERQHRPAAFSVFTVAAGDAPVTAFGGLRLLPDRHVAEVEDVDVLVVPGAIAIDRVEADASVMGAISDLAARAGLATSVCTGAFLLERAGLLEGREATTHWEDVPGLSERAAVGRIRDDVRWVDAGEVVTSGGISSGVAMALHLVERFVDRELAEATARQIDYVWTESRPGP